MTEILVYIALSIAWGVGGFTGGYILGARGLKKLAEVFPEADEPEKRPAMTSPIEHEPRTTNTLPWFRRTQVWLGVTVVLVGAGTVAQGYILGNRTSDLVKCQQAYSTGFADALDARSKASQEVADQADELWRKVYSLVSQAQTPGAREEFGKALGEYLAARDKAKTTTGQNPYPPAPRELCGEA